MNVTVRRERGFYAMARPLTLLADGREVGAVKQGKTVTLTVPDGAQELSGKMDWAETGALPLGALKPGDIVVIRVGSLANPLSWFGIGGLPFRLSIEQG